MIRDLDLELDRGDRLALVGENGVGKSTLMRALAGAAPVADGQVTLGIGVTTGYYAQDRAEQLIGSGSVLEYMEAVAPTDMVPRVRNLLGAFLFSGDEVFKPLSVLSGGERSRVALVRLLLEPANLLLLDEPTSHLDLSSISVLTHALRSYAGTLLFASHDEYLIERLATKVLEVSRDRVRLYHGGWDYYSWKRSGAGGPTAAGAAGGAAHGRRTMDAGVHRGHRHRPPRSPSWRRRCRRPRPRHPAPERQGRAARPLGARGGAAVGAGVRIGSGRKPARQGRQGPPSPAGHRRRPAEAPAELLDELDRLQRRAAAAVRNQRSRGLHRWRPRARIEAPAHGQQPRTTAHHGGVGGDGTTVSNEPAGETYWEYAAGRDNVDAGG